MQQVPKEPVAMQWTPHCEGLKYERVTTADVRLGYRVFLGREPEHREALLAKRSLTFSQLFQGFLSSEEFAVDVAGRIVAGKPWAQDRFARPIDSRVLLWAARRLATEAKPRSEVIDAISWFGLYSGLLSDAGFRAMLDAAAGAGAAERMAGGLKQVLAHRRFSTAAHEDQSLAVGGGPRISIVVHTGGANIDEFVKFISALRRQNYMRWELIVIDDQEAEDVALAVDALAAMDGRIRLDTPPIGLDAMAKLRAGVDMANGDYVFFPSPQEPLAANVLSIMAAAALAQARPPIVRLSQHLDPEGPAGLISITAAAGAGDDGLAALAGGMASARTSPPAPRCPPSLS